MFNPRAKHSCEFVDDKNLVMLSKDYIDLAVPKTNNKKNLLVFKLGFQLYYSNPWQS